MRDVKQLTFQALTNYMVLYLRIVRKRNVARFFIELQRRFSLRRGFEFYASLGVFGKLFVWDATISRMHEIQSYIYFKLFISSRVYYCVNSCYGSAYIMM